MRDRLFSDLDEDRKDKDIDEDEVEDEEGEEDELGLEDELAEELDASEDDLAPNGDENRVGLVLDENEVDENEAGSMERFACAFCGEMNDLFVDRTASKHQQFTEDCEVCCRPNLVTVYIDPDGGTWIDAEQEYEA
jgi:hypothetical protein